MSTFRIFSNGKKEDIPFHPDSETKYFVPISSKTIREIFSDCADFQSRGIWPGGKKIAGLNLYWLEAVTNGKDVSEDVVRPLTDPARFQDCESLHDYAERVLHGLVYSGAVKKRDRMDDVVADLQQGHSILILDRAGIAISFENRTNLNRSIGEPSMEKTLKGAKDAFVETMRVNTSLVRRHLRTPDLKLTQLVVGRRSRTPVAIMFVKGIANDTLVAELMGRLEKLDIDGLTSAGNLEQYIVDCPASPFPQLLHTERPDKFVIELLNGRVGLLVDGIPMGFLLPVTINQFMRVAEDRAQHWLVSSAILLLRWLSLVLSVLLPALFVAVSMYHQEMIPLKLLLSMIQAKQQVPFSAAVEILALLIAFELLQEAGLRLPNPVGDTVSIIGALIIGQSAVEAKVVSPVAVIIVAAAGICGFTLPSRDMAAALRMIRLALVLLAIMLGLFGVMLGLVLLIWHLSSLDSFGVAYVSPLSEGGLNNLLRGLLRPPLPRSKLRDPALRTGDKRNQK